MTAEPADARPRSNAWMVIFVAAPLAVLAFSYVADVIFGTKAIVLPGSPARGIERFAAITLVVCALEIFLGAFVLLRAGRASSFAGLTAYLFLISLLALLFGTFRA